MSLKRNGGPSGTSLPLGVCQEDGLIPQCDRDVLALQMFITVSPSLCLQQSPVVVEREVLLFQ